MKLENKKVVLIVILILLFISLSLGLGGLLLKVFNKEETPVISNIPDNPNKESKYEGYLYYFDTNETLLGVYKCKNVDGVCDFATESLDDETYSLNFYNDNIIDKLNIVNNRYVFVIDEAINPETHEVILYDIKNDKQIARYKSIKNYTIGIENEKYIVENNDGKFGVITLSGETPVLILGFEYDYIGIVNKQNENNVLFGNKYVVKKDAKWFITDDNATEVSTPMNDSINNFNSNLITVKINNIYYLFEYSGQQTLETTGYKHLNFANEYIVIVSKDNLLYVYDYDRRRPITQEIPVLNSTYDVKVNADGNIDITINGQTTTYDI